MKRITALAIFVIFLASLDSFAGDISKATMYFNEGNSSYRNGDYEEAAANYNRVIETGYESGHVYYNLGNAYFRNGELGESVCAYLKAKRLMPRDADLKSNLEYAGSFVKGGFLRVQRNPFAAFLTGLAESFSLDRITIFLVISYLVFTALLTARILAFRFSRPLRWGVILSAAALAFFVLLFSLRLYEVTSVERGVVVAENVNARFEPAEEATTFFKLNEGESVIIEKEEKGWLKIKLPDGKLGWVREEKLSRI